MEHTKIVLPSELEDFADRRDSEPVIPELIWLLVTTSCKDLTLCRIPYHDSIGLPGLDGVVQTEIGFRQYVPKKTSFWEMGRGERARDKATSDYRKRTKKTPAEERANTAFVFITPRSKDWDQARQAKWVRTRQTRREWADIKILDGIQLCDWLREFPAIGKWLAQRIGLVKSSTGLRTPAEHWQGLEQLKEQGDPSLPPQVFLTGRDEACKELDRLFKGETQQVILAIESENDAEDFVAAFLQSLDQGTRDEYGSRCLFISEPDAWNTFSNLQTPHVFVANPSLDLGDSWEQLHIAARARGHRIVFPVLGPTSYGGGDVVPILSPSRSLLEKALVEGKFRLERAGELAAIGANSLVALKRRLRGMGALPPYVNWSSARLLAQASLIGSWRGDNPGDRAAIETLLGKAYGEWIEAARPETLRPDTPLFQRNEVWKVISRAEVWSALGQHLSDEDLDRFRRVCVQVLGERDARFDLPKDKREISFIRAEPISHSKALRAALSESLALLGAEPGALTTISLGKAEATARLVVRELLRKGDWTAWASLNDQMPLIAEAAPEEFLSALEEALLDPRTSVFADLFREEGAGFAGRNYMTGILWGLETLAWSTDYLGRVTLILGDLASIDPGGNWANRPSNSLSDIFLPWHFQTTATLSQRKTAIEALRREHPVVAWKLLLSLLPSFHGTTSGTRKPAWRSYVSRTWRPEISGQDYWEQVIVYARLAVEMAQTDLERLIEIVDRLPNVPEPAQSQILEHLTSPAVVSLPEEGRRKLWEALKDLVAKHRKFSDAKWAMPRDRIEKIENAAKLLEPVSYELANLRLFTEREWDLYGENVDFKSETTKLENRRQDVVRVILKAEGATGVLSFAAKADAPHKVGETLGAISDQEIDAFLLPDFLLRSEKEISLCVSAFVWQRYWIGGIGWVERQLTSDWKLELQLAFLLLLPTEKQVWERAETVLGDQRGEYWKQVRFNPWRLELNDELIAAAERLTAYEQPAAAVDCLYVLSHKKQAIPIVLAKSALLGALKTEGQAQRLVHQHVMEVIKSLQTREPLDSDSLFQIEWNYLPLLNRITGGEPKALEWRLASSPEFFCELIGKVFRSDKEDSANPSEPTELDKQIAQNAYALLHGWRILPGTTPDGGFDEKRFSAWLVTVKSLAKDSGHFRIAMDQLGQALAYAPADAGGLWIHRAIASALDERDATQMRRGFTVGLFNRRGVHGFSRGAEEKQLAGTYRDKAMALSNEGYHRAADSVREIAQGYEHDAQRESKRDIFDEP